MTISRRAALAIAVGASGLVAAAVAGPVLLWRAVLGPLVGRLEGQGGASGGGMMGAATTADMGSYEGMPAMMGGMMGG